jgi:hypothetical protein
MISRGVTAQLSDGGSFRMPSISEAKIVSRMFSCIMAGGRLKPFREARRAKTAGKSCVSQGI